MVEQLATAVPRLAFSKFRTNSLYWDRQNFNASDADVRPTLGDIGPTAL
jgi:hypothetical protein